MEAILAIVALVGLTWALVLLCRGGPLAGCLAVLLASCCFGHAFFNLPVGPIPLTLDRVLWLGLMGAFVTCRRWGWAESRPWGPAEWALGGFVLVLLASTLLHDWRHNGYEPLAHLLFFYLMPVGVYFVARESRMSERGVLVLLGGLALMGVYLALTGVAEVRGQWWAVYPKYIAQPEAGGFFFGRARGPFLNPIANGYYQTVGLVAAMLLWPRLGRYGRAGVAGALAVFALGLYATLTRSVWLGAALSAMLVLALATPRRWRMPLVGGALLLGTVVAATQWERLLVYKRDQALGAQEAAESVKLRPILARVAWNMFLDRPAFGCGYGQYRSAQIDYLSDRSTELPLGKARPYVQHNVFLALLAETGLVGLGLFVVLLALWTRDAWRLWRSETSPDWVRAQALLFLAMMGSYLTNAMFHDLSLMPQANMLLFLLAGATTALRCQAEGIHTALSPGSPRTCYIPMWGDIASRPER
ncbi:MAG: O-antigen ligase family protein [Pirellulales bacterium]|nr:O-antigen ligase family protein [Pirellulales bacterium]